MNYNNDDDYESDELAAFWADRRRRALGNKSFLSKEKKSFKEETTRDVLEKLLADYDDEMNYNPDRRKTLFPQPEMLFDGRKFGVYYNGIPQLEVDAMSGKKGFQNIEYTPFENHGPIPEGDWDIDPQELEEYSPEKERVGFYDRHVNDIVPWTGATRSWGKHRVKLVPESDTETFGRSGFYLHGGDELGSGGCIDTTHSMEDIVPYIRRAKKPIRIGVKYKSDDFER